MTTPNTTTTPKSPSKRELQDEVRKLRLENQGYRVFGTPMDIAVKIKFQPPVCYYCNFQIPDKDSCAIIETSEDRYWLHHECLDNGVDLIKSVELDSVKIKGR